MTKDTQTSLEQKINAAVIAINAEADELHLDITPAVSALANLGLKAVPSLLKLLMHDDEMTRLHGQRALDLLINKRHGFIPGQGFPSDADENAALDEWQGNGNYDYNANQASRSVAIAKWQHWLDSVEE